MTDFIKCSNLETKLNLDYYLKIKEYNRTLNYEENDIRLEYFQMMASIFDRYHKGFATLDLIKYLADNKVLHDDIQNQESLKYVFNDYYDISHMYGYYADLSRRFLIDSWSVFELTVTQLLDCMIVSDSEKETFKNKDCNDILKVLKDEVSSGTEEKLKKLLKSAQVCKDNFTHISITRKTDKLFSLIKSCYSRDLNKDKEFLKFLGKYRNTLHLNFVYSGKDYHYLYENLVFSFQDGQTVRTPREPWEARVVSELVEIVKGINKCIEKQYMKSKISYSYK